ncbi:hypothetical protein [Ephemeroptericola cinctiostellae]|uniref:hypothetical protein n=1 Tax=Ephemeroptericola cinctiostellae TaxID=2268024 RepID=UPI000DF7C5BE|nr:hypothetical protein [Ephemeroptericola cinctiostellae]
MQLKPPNTAALAMLIVGLSSLVLWYALQSTADTDASWQTFAQKLALLLMGGLLTIVGLNLTWSSMKPPSDKDKPSKST